MKRILAPHKEQDGYRYIRVANDETHIGWDSGSPFGIVTMEYSDDEPDMRIISSRKVEEAVETLEYLRLCAAWNLGVVFIGLCATSGETRPSRSKPLSASHTHPKPPSRSCGL